jgi:hypothetical protein
MISSSFMYSQQQDQQAQQSCFVAKLLNQFVGLHFNIYHAFISSNFPQWDNFLIRASRFKASDRHEQVSV